MEIQARMNAEMKMLWVLQRWGRKDRDALTRRRRVCSVSYKVLSRGWLVLEAILTRKHAAKMEKTED